MFPTLLWVAIKTQSHVKTQMLQTSYTYQHIHNFDNFKDVCDESQVYKFFNKTLD